MDIQDQIKNTIQSKLTSENLKPSSPKKKILLAVIAILLGALGLEATNTDFNLGKLLSGSSLSDSAVMRDKAGNVVTDGSGKATNDYNCSDFATQQEAQTFFLKAGGISKDTNRLDGNKDGIACQDLPKSTK